MNKNIKIAKHLIKIAKQLISEETNEIYEDIQLALVDYFSTGYTIGEAEKLIHQFSEAIEKSKIQFNKKNYEQAKKEIEFIGDNMKKLSVFGGSWKKWGLSIKGWQKVYHEYYMRLSKAFIDLRHNIEDYNHTCYNNSFYCDYE